MLGLKNNEVTASDECILGGGFFMKKVNLESSWI